MPVILPGIRHGLSSAKLGYGNGCRGKAAKSAERNPANRRRAVTLRDPCFALNRLLQASSFLEDRLRGRQPIKIVPQLSAHPKLEVKAKAASNPAIKIVPQLSALSSAEAKAAYSSRCRIRFEDSRSRSQPCFPPTDFANSAQLLKLKRADRPIRLSVLLPSSSSSSFLVLWRPGLPEPLPTAPSSQQKTERPRAASAVFFSKKQRSAPLIRHLLVFFCCGERKRTDQDEDAAGRCRFAVTRKTAAAGARIEVLGPQSALNLNCLPAPSHPLVPKDKPVSPQIVKLAKLFIHDPGKARWQARSEAPPTCLLAVDYRR
ncbi:hypothetical protein C8R43DRAFT_941345 [Mycena crocata]|nr:hypothetical protein C8R43DRAFT_941345 [Mycena crocata]